MRVSGDALLFESDAARPLAFEDVYEMYADRVYRFCLFLLHDPSVAEDVAADTMMAAYAAYDRAHPEPDGVVVWLLRIAKNRSIDHIRRAQRLRRIVKLLGRSAPNDVDVELAAAARDNLRLVLDSVATLRPKDRVLLGLRAAGMTHAEIGHTLGMSESAAVSATRRAVDKARTVYEGFS